MAATDTLAKPRWFSPETSALVLIDHQIGTMQLVKNIGSDAALRNAVLLAKAAKTLGMPIVMTASMEDHLQGPLSTALQLVAPEAYEARVKRLGIVNAWADPNFKAAVEATGRKQLVMAGVTTDICLVFPSINAVNEGYDVQAVLDASDPPMNCRRTPHGAGWNGRRGAHGD
jgi:nicotinamidase-related amidase